MSRTILLLAASALLGCSSGRAKPVAFSLVEQHPRPVLARGMPGTADNKYGFEGGRVVKVGGMYHLFTSEMIADPKWAKTRLAHWSSDDRLTWKRISTLRESSGDYTGQDPRAALFLPIPIYDPQDERWNLFYSAFRSAPNSGGRWLINHDGRIWRAASRTPGPEGIGGPYDDLGVILAPGPDSDPWEGLQGVDSFFPFRTGSRWRAFYGSAQTQKWPCEFWGVGLVEAPKLAGPWKRLSKLNPIPIDKRWVENPQVLRLRDGAYAAVFDATPQGRAIGYTGSPDGKHWAEGKYVKLSAGEGDWLKQSRVPLGLIERADGDFDVFFTGYDQSGYGCVSLATLRRE
jgi:hypothetical protein